MQSSPKVIEVREPHIVWRLFNTTTFAWLWLILRVWLGIQWLQSGIGKLGNPAWMSGGTALRGFWTNAVALPEGGRPPIAFDWYREFINFMLQNGWYTWFGPLIAIWVRESLHASAGTVRSSLTSRAVTGINCMYP